MQKSAILFLALCLPCSAANLHSECALYLLEDLGIAHAPSILTLSAKQRSEISEHLAGPKPLSAAVTQELNDAFTAMLWPFLLEEIGDAHAALDVLQETLIEVLQRANARSGALWHLIRFAKVTAGQNAEEFLRRSQDDLIVPSGRMAWASKRWSAVERQWEEKRNWKRGISVELELVFQRLNVQRPEELQKYSIDEIAHAAFKVKKDGVGQLLKELEPILDEYNLLLGIPQELNLLNKASLRRLRVQDPRLGVDSATVRILQKNGIHLIGDLNGMLLKKVGEVAGYDWGFLDRLDQIGMLDPAQMHPPRKRTKKLNSGSIYDYRIVKFLSLPVWTILRNAGFKSLNEIREKPRAKLKKLLKSKWPALEEALERHRLIEPRRRPRTTPSLSATETPLYLAPPPVPTPRAVPPPLPRRLIVDGAAGVALPIAGIAPPPVVRIHPDIGAIVPPPVVPDIPPLAKPQGKFVKALRWLGIWGD